MPPEFHSQLGSDTIVFEQLSDVCGGRSRSRIASRRWESRRADEGYDEALADDAESPSNDPDAIRVPSREKAKLRTLLSWLPSVNSSPP